MSLDLFIKTDLIMSMSSQESLDFVRQAYRFLLPIVVTKGVQGSMFTFSCDFSQIILIVREYNNYYHLPTIYNNACKLMDGNNHVMCTSCMC